MAEHTFNLGRAEGAGRVAPNRVAYGLSEGGNIVGALCGVGAVVLAILGLIGMAPRILDAAAIIAAGTALLFQGGAMSAAFTRRMGVQEPASLEKEIAGSLGFQALAGCAGIVLGILALLNISPIIMLSAAVIAMGAGLLLSGGALSRLEKSLAYHQEGQQEKVAHGTVYASGGADALVGIGAATLGILALLRIGDPFTLTLVAVLAIGAAGFFSGSAIAARLYSLFQ
jgi:hypothetical protein